MLIFTNPLATEHDPGPGHVERPEREVACVAGLRAARVVAEFADASPASRQQLERVHNSSFLDWLEQFCAAGGGWIDSDTFAGQRSFEASAFASGACCRAVEMAVERGTSSVSMVRPPGHHAGPKYAMGFASPTTPR
jgi:acetoin utilization deacetylase AcuC-like enzyme